MKKNILMMAIFALFLGFALAGCVSDNSGQVSGQSTSDVPVPTDLIKQAYAKGPEDAKVTIVVFSDFQCPACGYAYTQMKEVLAKYGDKIRFAVRHFPLSYHSYALEAAYSAEAAGLQGKFWEMYDLIYTNQSSLNSQKFLDF
ncbi:MAG: DsbA family protein, partial [Patescibacteria group bacterium]|nr:DsbA family protein [Patescibacteria group bacterium]